MIWVQKQKLVHFNFKSANQRHVEAVAAYEVLGPLASAQVPSLIDLLSNGSSPEVRYNAASALGDIRPEAKLAGPALSRATADPNPHDYAAQFVLPGAEVGYADPELTVPVLIAGLDDTDRTARENAAIALGRYGQQAKAAIPALVRTLPTNGAAGFSLKKIDPEAAAKAGVK